MVYNKNFITEDSNELAYDLRQKLANQLGDIRKDILEAREARNYPKWLSFMDSLFIEISQKVDVEEEGEFNVLMKKVNEVIQKNRLAFTNPKFDGQEIYVSLRKMNLWVNKKMEKYNMFGSKDTEDDGL